ncbi:MAG: hypothetical protein J0I49_30050 [Pseudonocardia sp.]|uniref:hypothetical protein n=1 Tax=Pseudonocardia sp. TaxID=60912 RepID=UPI001AD450DA|nr:hypothetical protein [Pseudonocardia sp.]MBN9102308.1 hypothetical protein [Pseudonocardia sp.]
METGTLIAQIASAVGGAGGALRLYRSQAHRMRSEIDANRDFADRFAEGSDARLRLHAYGDELVAAYIAKGRERLQTSYPWLSIVFAAIGVGGFGYWAYQAEALWLRIVLIGAAAVFAMSLLGLVFPSKPKRSDDASVAAPVDENVGTPVQRVMTAREQAREPDAGPARR